MLITVTRLFRLSVEEEVEEVDSWDDDGVPVTVTSKQTCICELSKQMVFASITSYKEKIRWKGMVVMRSIL
jgi:hypothetical protein